MTTKIAVLPGDGIGQRSEAVKVLNVLDLPLRWRWRRRRPHLTRMDIRFATCDLELAMEADAVLFWRCR
jgi:isocitrate/isopropylmalate dehydrogenase